VPLFFAREGPALDAPSAPATAQSQGSVRRAGTCCRARQVRGRARSARHAPREVSRPRPVKRAGAADCDHGAGPCGREPADARMPSHIGADRERAGRSKPRDGGRLRSGVQTTGSATRCAAVLARAGSRRACRLAGPASTPRPRPRRKRRRRSNGDLAIVVLHDRADRLQQRDHGMPLDVMAHGMLEELAQHGAVMVAEVHRLCAR
jgi:hypothetical protein